MCRTEPQVVSSPEGPEPAERVEPGFGKECAVLWSKPRHFGTYANRLQSRRLFEQAQPKALSLPTGAEGPEPVEGFRHGIAPPFAPGISPALRSSPARRTVRIPRGAHGRR